MRILQSCLALALLALFAIPVHADSASYFYTGNPLANQNPLTGTPWVPGVPPCTCSIDGSFTLAAPLPASLFQGPVVPLAFQFGDGAYTLNQSDSTIASFTIGTDGQGNINFWTIVLEGVGADAGVDITTEFFGSDFEATDSVFANGHLVAYQQDSKGTWSNGSISTPEPGSLALVAFGFLALALLNSSKRKRLNS